MSKEYTAEEFRSVWKSGKAWEFNSGNIWTPANNPTQVPAFGQNTRYRLAQSEPSVSDPVHRPNHYYVPVKVPGVMTKDTVEIDCFSVSDALEFHKHHYIASAFAYIWRCLRKNNTVEDLKKAVVYLNKEIALREAK